MKKRIKKDILWKSIIEDLFEDFLEFFYPDKMDEINFSRGFEFLDKELQAIMPENEQGRRFVDKLVKVFLKNGEEKWILFHIEVQGYIDSNFKERMFIYYYRVFDKFKMPINALAIFTEEYPNYQPDSYSNGFWNTRIQYTFDTYKVLEKKEADFDVFKNNPFAIVMKTVWFTLQKNRKKKPGLLNIKIKIARQLMKNGFSLEKTQKVLNFLGHYIYLQKPEERRTFEKEIDSLTKPHKHMGIIEAIEEELKRQEFEEGHEQGIEQGLKRSIIKMYNKDFKMKEIADILEIDISVVEKAISKS